MDFPEADWYRDPIRPAHVQFFKQRRVLFTGQTRFQAVRIVDTEAFGRLLELDGKTQSTQGDEFIYHEALVHPALLLHPDPKRVLIAGGGEGATLREVLLHRGVREAVMVDIDGELVELCRRHLPEWSAGAFDDPRARLVIGDALVYLQEAPTLFDVIIMDITDPADGGPSLALFTQDFYTMVLQRLTPNGILVVQSGAASLESSEVFSAVAHTLATAGAKVRPYRTTVASFGGDWGFTLASKLPLPAVTPAELDERIAKRMSKVPRSFDGVTYVGMAALPKWLRVRLAAERHVITANDPVFLQTT